MQNAEKDLIPRTKKFARRVIRLYVALPKNNTVAQVLGKQALRSGTSVGANYREANRARSKPEFIAKIGDCLKEADETLYWLELMTDEGILPSSRLRLILEEADDWPQYLPQFQNEPEAINEPLLHSVFYLLHSI